jgi:hypothetical protein
MCSCLWISQTTGTHLEDEQVDRQPVNYRYASRPPKGRIIVIDAIDEPAAEF